MKTPRTSPVEQRNDAPDALALINDTAHLESCTLQQITSALEAAGCEHAEPDEMNMDSSTRLARSRSAMIRTADGHLAHVWVSNAGTYSVTDISPATEDSYTEDEGMRIWSYVTWYRQTFPEACAEGEAFKKVIASLKPVKSVPVEQSRRTYLEKIRTLIGKMSA